MAEPTEAGRMCRRERAVGQVEDARRMAKSCIDWIVRDQRVYTRGGLVERGQIVIYGQG